MKLKLTKKDIFTIPNAMSLFRILLIPLFVWLYIKTERRFAAVLVVVLSGLTDIADGFIARHFNMISDVGKVLDPIADKLTQAALLVCLASRYHVLWWVFALLCVKEMLQAALGWAAIRVTGEMQMALWYGKVSTGIFYGSMILLLLFPMIPETWAYVLIGLCAAALMTAMILYVRHDLILIWNILFPDRSRHGLWAQLFMLLMWAAVIVFCWLHRDAVTIDGILRITPHSVFLAILFMMGLFALKSLSVVIYCGILYAASGILFTLPVAIAVNLVGTGVMAAVPYVLGRHMGGETLDRYVNAHKNAALLRKLRTDNTFLYTFLLRIINILPFDIVSTYLGAAKTKFVPYLLGSILGMATSCVLFPILGTNITRPHSPEFIISLVIEVAVSLLSFAWLVHERKKAEPTGEASPAGST